MRRVEQPRNITDPRVLRAIRTLEDAHFIAPTVAELAEEAGLSPDYFLKVFKEMTGTTPIDYLRRNWLDQAAFRLSTTSGSIADLYSDFGYLSQAAFTRAFTRRHGVSPKAYQAAALAASSASASDSVQLRHLASQSCWARRYLGAFADRRRHWTDFLERLPASLSEGEAFIGLNHDDPRVRPPEEQRYDCCVVSQREVAPEEEASLVADGFQPFLTTAGLYACCGYDGALTEVREAYASLLTSWLPRQQRYVIAGEPIVEAFGSSRAAMLEGRVQLEVCTKVALRSSSVNWTAGRDQRIAAEEADVE